MQETKTKEFRYADIGESVDLRPCVFSLDDSETFLAIGYHDGSVVVMSIEDKCMLWTSRRRERGGGGKVNTIDWLKDCQLLTAGWSACLYPYSYSYPYSYPYSYSCPYSYSYSYPYLYPYLYSYPYYPYSYPYI